MYNYLKGGITVKEYTHVKHTFEPIFDSGSKVLILGTLPSVKSREQNFYYGHPQNRFWKIIADITDSPFPLTIEDKKKMLLESGIAVWDVISECDIIGSSDTSIKNVIPTDLSIITDSCDIKAIFANGSTAAKLYNKYQLPDTMTDIITLPSTSPANAAWRYDRLKVEWQRQILPLIT